MIPLRDFQKYARHLPDCRIGSRVRCDPQATFGAACSCGLSELLDLYSSVTERIAAHRFSPSVPEQGGSE
jgi:hypothetical protein